MSPIPPNRPRTVVLLQYTGIGDLVWHIPYFKRLAELSANGQITVVAQPSTLARHFIGHEPWVEAVIDHDHRPRRGEKRRGQHAGLRGMWRIAQELKAGRYDRLILFSGRASRGLIAGLSGIPVRLGFGYRWLQRIFLTQGPYIQPYQGPSLAVFPESEAFMLAHGFIPAPFAPKMDVPDTAMDAMRARLASLPRPLVALAIGTSETHKQWGIDRYAQLACRLLKAGCGVLVLGGPAEKQQAQALAAQVPNDLKAGFMVVTDAPVMGSAAALKLCDHCVGNDTGMVNVSAAVGTPTHVIIGARSTLDHDPATLHNVKAGSLAAISVDEVVGLLQSALPRSRLTSTAQPS
jgi:heptosyltransferase-2